MTPTETLSMIHYAGQKWGAAAGVPTEPDLLEARVEVWMDALADVPVAVVRAALANAETEFPPQPLQLRRLCEDLAGMTPTLPDWDEFWRWAREQASRASLYLLDDPPAVECPWPELAALVTAKTLADWARVEMKAADFELVAQAHLRRQYDARAARARREATTPAPAVAEFLAARDQPALPVLATVVKTVDGALRPEGER